MNLIEAHSHFALLKEKYTKVAQKVDYPNVGACYHAHYDSLTYSIFTVSLLGSGENHKRIVKNEVVFLVGVNVPEKEAEEIIQLILEELSYD